MLRTVRMDQHRRWYVDPAATDPVTLQAAVPVAEAPKQCPAWWRRWLAGLGVVEAATK